MKITETCMFDKDSIRVFRFIRHTFDWNTGKITLVYAFDKGPEFVEVIIIPGAPFQKHPLRLEAIARTLRLVHLFAGVSYYKSAMPTHVSFEDNHAPMDQCTFDLVRAVYTKGLAECAFRNQVSLAHRFTNHSALSTPPSLAKQAQLSPHALVAIGGGKDSLVTIETLKKLNIRQTLVWIGKAPLIAECARCTKLPYLQIQRILSPELLRINQQHAWNGHVPVTAVHSSILALTALLHNMDQIVFSNEYSASNGSQIDGIDVNHQWSKGWEFEHAFGSYVERYIATDLHYYSLLRPYTELAIAKQFARITHYDAVFSSCNRNFHQHGVTPSQRWCGRCPKCHFVFLALAVFIPKKRLLDIFSATNLLDNPENAAGFDALLEYKQHKPFECVGEARESHAAFAYLMDDPRWSADALVKRYKDFIHPSKDTEHDNLETVLRSNPIHRIPSQLWNQVDALFTAT